MAAAAGEARWLLLIHQLPPKPAYLRVKVGRRLARLGAVAIKNSVYALPASEARREELSWVTKEIARDGGDASVVDARFVDGLSDEAVRGLFQAARDADYREVANEARAVLRTLSHASEERRTQARERHARLIRRMAELAPLDFFAAPGKLAATRLLADLEKGVASDLAAPPARPPAILDRRAYRGRTWVTRAGIHVDRMASAWLIRRFIDEKARFVFGAAPGSTAGVRPKAGALRFDMFEGEFTHDGDLCTFEVLLRRFGLGDPGLVPIAEIVHDIDLRDGRHGRPETAGVERLVAAIALAHRRDEDRLARASAVLDDLYELWKRKRP
jgi:hypothetical protein